MGRALVGGQGKPAADDPLERRKILARELDIHGGRPSKVAQSLGVSLASLQRWLDEAGLRGEAKRARDRWERMFAIGGGKDGADGETET
jgi:hypothetical protein